MAELQVIQGKNSFEISKVGAGAKENYFRVYEKAVEVGDNDTTLDVKFWGASDGAYMYWDSSADTLKFVGASGIDLEGTIGLTISGTNYFTVESTATNGIVMSGTFTNGIDFGGEYTNAINIDGTCTAAIRIDLSDDLSSSATYNKSIYSTQILSGEDSSDGGGLQGIRSDTNNSTYDNSWQVSLQGRATATGTATVGDTIGCYAAVKTVGALTDVSSGTGSMCAFKGDVSDSPGSAWDANVHGIMIGYASQINYGGKTSLFFGYTHGTAHCDYGLLIDNYSPNMAAGIYLTETSGSSPDMTSGIKIDTTCDVGIDLDLEYAGGDINKYGLHIDILQTDETSGSYGSRGNIQAIKSVVNLTEQIDDAYGVRGDVNIDLAGTDELNQCAGVLGVLDIANSNVVSQGGAGTLNAGLFILDIGTGTTVEQKVHALHVQSRVKSNIAGVTNGILVDIDCSSTNYTDYGISIVSMSTNQTAAMRIYSNSQALPVGLLLHGDSSVLSGTITAAIEVKGTGSFVFDFDDAENGWVDATTTQYSTTAAGHILVKMQDGGTAYINCWEA